MWSKLPLVTLTYFLNIDSLGSRFDNSVYLCLSLLHLGNAVQTAADHTDPLYPKWPKPPANERSHVLLRSYAHESPATQFSLSVAD